MRGWRQVLLLAIAAVATCPGIANAQSGASITGVVKDASGAVLPAAGMAALENRRGIRKTRNKATTMTKTILNIGSLRSVSARWRAINI